MFGLHLEGLVARDGVSEESLVEAVYNECRYDAYIGGEDGGGCVFRQGRYDSAGECCNRSELDIVRVELWVVDTLGTANASASHSMARSYGDRFDLLRVGDGRRIDVDGHCEGEGCCGSGSVRRPITCG